LTGKSGIATGLKTVCRKRYSQGEVRIDILPLAAGKGHAEAVEVFYTPILTNIFLTGVTGIK
jgi:hypothetical protein